MPKLCHALALFALTFVIGACSPDVSPTAVKDEQLAVTGAGEFQIQIDGMSCERCAATVKSRLERRLPQLKALSVDAVSGRATFRLEENEPLSLDDCRQALDGMGYQANSLARATP